MGDHGRARLPGHRTTIVEFGRAARSGYTHPLDEQPRADSGPAPVAQRIEHLTTDQKVGGSNPFGRAPFYLRRCVIAPPLRPLSGLARWECSGNSSVGLPRSWRQGLADPVCGCPSHRRTDVGVEVRGDPQRRVTKPLRDHLQLYAGSQRHARVGVPKVVQPDPRQPGLLGHGLEVPRDVFGP